MTTPSQALTRTGLAALATAALAAVGLADTVTPAAAHAYLVDSTPQDDAAVDESPTEIILEFNEPLEPEFTQVAIVDRDERPLDLDEPEVDGPLVTQPVGELAPGTYEVNYRVGSADGHPVSGTITFTVTEAAAAAPSPTTTQPTAAATAEPPASEPTAAVATATPTTEPETAEADTNTAMLFGGAAVVAVAAAATLVLIRRRLGQGGDGE